MASFNTLNTYDASARIPEFKGLMQYGDGLNTDPRYAAEEKNLETIGGVLQPAAACEALPPTLPAPIETLALLHRRWHTQSDEKNILIAASAGKLYAMLPSADEWTELACPEGVAAFESNNWSCVTYEINPEGSDASVDVLLMSNALDGMVMVRIPAFYAKFVTDGTNGKTMTLINVDTCCRTSCICCNSILNVQLVIAYCD